MAKRCLNYWSEATFPACLALLTVDIVLAVGAVALPGLKLVLSDSTAEAHLVLPAIEVQPARRVARLAEQTQAA